MLGGIPDAGVDLKIADPAGIVELSTTIKRRPSIRRDVRRLLEGQLKTLYDAINVELLPAVNARLADLGYDGLLVIVDQLDRVSAADDRHGMLFWHGSDKLRALDCHILYTAPIEYAYSRACPQLEGLYGEILGLPQIPVTASDPILREQALALTKRIAMERIEGCGTSEQELFEAGALDEFVQLSGGHVRTLFLLVRTAIERSDLVAPLTRAHTSGVIAGLAARYLDPLGAAEREVALEVHETGGKPEDEARLECFHALLRDQYVFGYRVGGQVWYGLNPLLHRSTLGRSR